MIVIPFGDKRNSYVRWQFLSSVPCVLPLSGHVSCRIFPCTRRRRETREEARKKVCVTSGIKWPIVPDGGVKELILLGGGGGRCLAGSCVFDPSRNLFGHLDLTILPAGANVLQDRKEFVPFWASYIRQVHLSESFDIDVHPGLSPAARVTPYLDFSYQFESLMELASHAISEYNEKECNVYKYKVLKIEKVNTLQTAYYCYYMTVEVLYLTLATPIETFQIDVAKHVFNHNIVILCCRPKEEVIT
ncbi:uncharacterized protein [Nicotiana tomentosiformis]|uniref:uncharacterized protein n=1 Tax=Nicotiana tomentosiformis TaxID=4098 RepID=UPI00051C80B8|nr:uncharacterized protein LOC117276080 [Nicotiana tomentosiformis]